MIMSMGPYSLSAFVSLFSKKIFSAHQIVSGHQFSNYFGNYHWWSIVLVLCLNLKKEIIG